MKWEIRVALEADAADISRVILAALRETNAKDYSSDVIEQVERSFGPEAVLELIRRRKVFVAVTGSRIVGTASLEEQSVRTVFVSPDVQGQGVGRLLMAAVERAALEAGVETLVVPSSLTAEPFYSKLGFRAVRDSYHGEERTIIMERSLT
jgi:predicted N-acetyltransferase YhbS